MKKSKIYLSLDLGIHAPRILERVDAFLKKMGKGISFVGGAIPLRRDDIMVVVLRKTEGKRQWHMTYVFRLKNGRLARQCFLDAEHETGVRRHELISVGIERGRIIIWIDSIDLNPVIGGYGGGGRYRRVGIIIPMKKFPFLR